jgi:hypothetical protein
MNFAYEVEDLGTKGKGIIFKETRKKGDVIYDFANETAKIVVKDEDLDAYLANDPNITDVLDHGFCSGTNFIDLRNCDIRFTNHSFDPCSEFNHETGLSIALRDIEIGDEFTENYWNYETPERYDSLMKKYLNGNFKEQSENWK